MVVKQIFKSFLSFLIFVFLGIKFIFGADNFLYNKESDMYYQIDYKEYSKKKDSYYQCFEFDEPLSSDEIVVEKAREAIEKQKKIIGSLPLEESLLEQDKKYQSSCLLEVYYANVNGEAKVYYGSGVLISPNIILTAAHNIYDPKDGGKYPDRIDCLQACFKNHYLAKVTIFPKKDIGSIYIHSKYKKKVQRSIEYTKEENSPEGFQLEREDIGFIVDKKVFDSKIFSIPLILNPLVLKSSKDGIDSAITGYSGGRIAYSNKGKIFSYSSEEGIIYHTINTTRGQSGSGIWLEEEGQVYCVGIHVGGDYPNKSYNIGVLIDKEIEKAIRRFALYEYRFNISDYESLTPDLYNPETHISYKAIDIKSINLTKVLDKLKDQLKKQEKNYRDKFIGSHERNFYHENILKIKLMLAQIYYRDKYHQEKNEALNVLEKVVNEDYEPAFFLLKDIIYHADKSDRYKERALNLLRQAVEKKCVPALFVLGKIYYKDENKDGAIELWNQAAEKRYAEAQYRLGKEYKSLGQYELAIKLLKAALEQGCKKKKKVFKIFNELGEMYNRNHDQENALWLWEQAATQGYNKARYNLWNTYKNLGNYLKALEWFETMLKEEHPSAVSTVEILTEAGELYYCDGAHQNKDRAVELWNQALEKEGHGEVEYYLWTLFKRKKDYPKALEWFEKALHQGYLGASTVEILEEAGELYYCDGAHQNKDRAIELWTQAAKKGYSNAQYKLGKAFKEQGRYDEAIPLLEEVLKHNPQIEVLKIFNELGEIYNRNHDQENALRLWEQAAIQGYDKAQYNLWNTYKNLGNYLKALEWFEKALHQGYLGASTVEILEEAGELYYCDGAHQNKDRAIELWTQAAKKGYSNAQYKLGKAFKERGRYDEAIPLLEETLKHNPQRPEIKEDLADAYYKRWDMNKKSEDYQKAKELGHPNTRRWFPFW